MTFLSLLNFVCTLPAWLLVHDSDRVLPVIPTTGAIMMVASSTDGFGVLDPVGQSISKLDWDLPMMHAFRTGVYVSLSGQLVLAPLEANVIKFLDAKTLRTTKDIYLRSAGGYRGAVVLSNGTVILTPSMGMMPDQTYSYAFVAVEPDAIHESDLRVFSFEGGLSTVYNNAILDSNGNVLLTPYMVTGSTRPLIGRFYPDSGIFRTIEVGTPLSGNGTTPWFQEAVLTPGGKVVFTPVSVHFIGIFDLETEVFEQVDITGMASPGQKRSLMVIS